MAAGFLIRSFMVPPRSLSAQGATVRRPAERTLRRAGTGERRLRRPPTRCRRGPRRRRGRWPGRVPRRRPCATPGRADEALERAVARSPRPRPESLTSSSSVDPLRRARSTTSPSPWRRALSTRLPSAWRRRSGSTSSTRPLRAPPCGSLARAQRRGRRTACGRSPAALPLYRLAADRQRTLGRAASTSRSSASCARRSHSSTAATSDSRAPAPRSFARSAASSSALTTATGCAARGWRRPRTAARARRTRAGDRASDSASGPGRGSRPGPPAEAAVRRPSSSDTWAARRRMASTGRSAPAASAYPSTEARTIPSGPPSSEGGHQAGQHLVASASERPATATVPAARAGPAPAWCPRPRRPRARTAARPRSARRRSAGVRTASRRAGAQQPLEAVLGLGRRARAADDHRLRAGPEVVIHRLVQVGPQLHVDEQPRPGQHHRRGQREGRGQPDADGQPPHGAPPSFRNRYPSPRTVSSEWMPNGPVELLAQVAHVDLHHVRALLEPHVPRRLQQLRLAQHLARAAA